MKIGFASDHRGFELKNYLMDNLTGVQIEDFGAYDNTSSDYPDFAFKLGESISRDVDFGVAICGSGIGISIAINKVKGVRAALVNTAEESRLTREHNNSNVIVFSANTDKKSALEMIKTFISTSFSNEERHVRRIKKISTYEEKND